MITKTELYIRNIVFGMIDSLVSTVGLLAGLSVAAVSSHDLIVTWVIYALVEGFSMAVGSFLSEQSVEDYKEKKQVDSKNSLTGGVVMFVTSVATAFIPLAPYLYLSPNNALWGSIILSILALFAVGMISGKIAKISMVKYGAKMAALGAAAIGIGLVVGKFLKI